MTYSYDQWKEDATDIYDELYELLASKQRDYGPYNISRAPGGAINGLMVRMNDKMERLKNLIYDEHGLVRDNGISHESIEDSFKDIANYAAICLMVTRGKWPE